MKTLLNDIDALRTGNKKFTLVLKDPLAHSFLQNPNHPGEDPRATRTFVPRSEEENETLGLNDINVDHYLRSPSDSMKKRDRRVSEGSVEEFDDKHSK